MYLPKVKTPSAAVGANFFPKTLKKGSLWPILVIMGRTYKLIELVGESDRGFSQAVANAITKASESLHGLSWFEVIEQRGAIRHGKVSKYQVKLKVAFRILENEEP